MVAQELNLTYEEETINGYVWYKDNLALNWSMVAKNDSFIATGKPSNLSSDDRVNALVGRVNELEANGERVLVVLNGGTNDALAKSVFGNTNFRVEIGTINSTHDETTYYGALQLWFDKLQ